MPIFEIEQWDWNVIHEYKALNYLSPFTEDAQAQRDGLLLQILYNQNISKKQNLKQAEELLPYLSKEPEWLEHELVKKAKSFIKLSTSPEMLADTLNKITEELKMELDKEEPDTFLVYKLIQLIRKNKRGELTTTSS